MKLFHLPYRIFCTLSRSVAEAFFREKRFIDWHKPLRYCLLDGSVYDRWDSEFSDPSIRFWDFNCKFVIFISSWP